jgi:hypothetical protein
MPDSPPNIFDDVYTFNECALRYGGQGHEVINIRQLRQVCDHVLEEYRELTVAADKLLENMEDAVGGAEFYKYYAETADAFIDLIYVATSGLYALDIKETTALEIWGAVHRANMAKFAECSTCKGTGWLSMQAQSCPSCNGGGLVPTMNSEGKVMKPRGWRAADIVSILRRSYATQDTD